jgi:NhaA family Na+:H+ antiporter
VKSLLDATPLAFIRAFLKHETSSGILLMAAAALALVLANSSLGPHYFEIQHVGIAGLSVLHWINDALMALFFLLVGLEIKREMLEGQLASWSQRVLPGIAAVGGMVVPALIYVAIGRGDADVLRGWAGADGHRHRVRSRRADAAGLAGADVAEAVSDRARDHRRSRRGHR